MPLSVRTTVEEDQPCQAKRYLVFRDPSYHAGLTPASQGTLVCQGGPMNQVEAEQFETLSNFQVGELEGGGRSGLHLICNCRRS